MSRIELTDTLVDVISKMSGGNPGAVVALTAIYKTTGEIDPQAALGALGLFGWLDGLEIYGTDIYILFNDKCGRDVRRFCILARAWQLGKLTSDEIKSMSKDQMREINLSKEYWKELDDFVCGELDRFKRPKQVESKI